MPVRSQAIKRSINRLVEPHRVQQRKPRRTPKARPSIPGRIGAAARVVRQEPT